VAAALADFKARISKPLLTCWMGDASVGEARTVLNTAMIPTFRTPEAAVGAFGNIASFYQNQQLLQQTPPPLSTLAKPDIEGARLLIESVLAERRNVLTEMESKALLSAFHIPVTKTILARNANEAMMIATQLGFPVALKIDSPDITHKSDVNGVALNVMNAVGVRDTYNDMMQAVKRKQPECAHQRRHHAGHGAQEARARAVHRRGHRRAVRPRDRLRRRRHHDRADERPRHGAAAAQPVPGAPADRALARDETLGEWRGARPSTWRRWSRCCCACPRWCASCRSCARWTSTPSSSTSTAPLPSMRASSSARRCRLRPAGAGKYGHLSILPYPQRYEQVWPLRGGGEYIIRPIHPDDADMLQDLMKRLTPEARYFRFVSNMAELPPGMLSRFTLIDYDREMALCAVVEEESISDSGEKLTKEKIIGVSRYITNPDQNSCEFSLVVDDAYGGQGVGTRLMLSIMDVAREKACKKSSAWC
jgi:acetyltransferase